LSSIGETSIGETSIGETSIGEISIGETSIGETMSATNRGAKRQDADFYPTPAASVISLLRKFPLFKEFKTWLEPCAGDGAIINAVSNYFPGADHTWTAVELRENTVHQQLIHTPKTHWVQPQDFLTWEPLTRYDICLTNPPFELAMPFIEKSMTMADTVVMLLRLNFLGSKERSQFHKDHPANIGVLEKRPCFINGSSDACEYAWFVWNVNEPGGRWIILD
jgi:hypothetical protein